MQIHIVANIINNIGITWNDDCGSTPNLFKPWFCYLSLWCCLWPKLISEFKFYFKGKHPTSLSELGERNLALCSLVVFWSLAYLQVCSLSLKDQKGGGSSWQPGQLVKRQPLLSSLKGSSVSELAQEFASHNESRSQLWASRQAA